MAKELSIGRVAARSGVAVSALHFYESKGLIASNRTAGNQRRYEKSVLRRLGVIKFAQELGIPLGEIKQALSSLPIERAPNKADWAKLSSRWANELNDRIARLQRLRDKLDGCIGCGCLSLDTCVMYNRDDELAVKGAGPRTLIE